MDYYKPQDLSEDLIQEYLSKLSNSAVLFARDTLVDGNFVAAILLICVYDKDNGAYGLVLNRPTHMPLSEVFDGFAGLEKHRKIYIGGPVQQDEMQVLRITDSPADESLQVASRVFLGGKWETVEQMLDLDEATTRLFLGYSGWASGQLEGEILAGAWSVYTVDVEKLLCNLDRTTTFDSAMIQEYLESIRV